MSSPAASSMDDSLLGLPLFWLKTQCHEYFIVFVMSLCVRYFKLSHMCCTSTQSMESPDAILPI